MISVASWTVCFRNCVAGQNIKKTTVCPKVAYNSFHMVFSAISGWILKPFDLQVATMCGFDIMYDKPVLPSKVPPCKWITFRHDLEKIKFSVNLTSTVWRFCRPW